MAWTEVETSTLAGAGSVIHSEQGAVLASASTVTLTDSYHLVSGTVTVNNFATTTGVVNNLFVIRPTGVFTIGTGGNIKGAPAVSVVDQHLAFWYDGTNFYYLRGISVSSDLNDTANIVRKNAANTYTAGPQSFTDFGNPTGTWQNFVVQIMNAAGTIQHAIMRDIDGSSAAAHADKVTGAQLALANTPSVAAGVGFTAGAGINAAATSQLVLNVAVPVANEVPIARIERNGTATPAVTAACIIRSLNVNGVTQNRLHIQFNDPATGFALTTANIGAGLSIWVRVTGFIA